MGGPVQSDTAEEYAGRMLRKFKEGPFRDLAFRRFAVPGDNDHWDLQFWNGRKIRVTRIEYNSWPEKDCVSNR